MGSLIPWMVGLMIYLGTLSLIATILLGQFSGKTGALEGDGMWQEKVSVITAPLLWMSLMMMSVIAFISVITLIYVTHSGLMIHEKIIRILKVLGAENHFIANQFQRYAVHVGVKGGFIGLSLSGATYFMMRRTVIAPLTDLNGAFLRGNEVEMGIILVLMPCVIMGIIVLATRLTVLYAMDDAESNGKWSS